VVEGVFDADECARLCALADGMAATGATIKGGDYREIRRCSVAWLEESEDTAWVWNRVLRLVADINRTHFGFRLDGVEELPQLLSYHGAREEYFDWHIDRGRSGLAARRKLTVALQLSAPEVYEGGDLEAFGDGHLWTAPRGVGIATVFAAFVPHRVAPVTAGVRRSLITFLHGPDFV